MGWGAPQPNRTANQTPHIDYHVGSTVELPYPTTNGGTQNGCSVGICTRCMHVFARLAPIYYAQSVLINKISASELNRKVIKSALLIGYIY